MSSFFFLLCHMILTLWGPLSKDGSVFVVKVGDEYLTNFVEKKRVEAEYFQYEEEDLRAPQPFEVLFDFQASEPSLGSINKVLYIDDLEHDSGSGVICTSAGISGQISVWSLPSTENVEEGAKQVATIGQVDAKQIISLALVTIPNDDVPMLVSVSCDGKISFFDLTGNFDEVASCKCVDDDEVLCADVSTSNDDERSGDSSMIYLGTSSGYVVGFRLKSLLEFAKSDVDSVLTMPTPDMRFRAHGADTGKGDSVTAIKCGGIGTIPASADLQSRSTSDAKSSVTSKILFTGGEDGSVKQWEILGKESPNGDLRLEHWPRMKTQRMKRRVRILVARKHLIGGSHLIFFRLICSWGTRGKSLAYHSRATSTIQSSFHLAKTGLSSYGMPPKARSYSEWTDFAIYQALHV